MVKKYYKLRQGVLFKHPHNGEALVLQSARMPSRSGIVDLFSSSGYLWGSYPLDVLQECDAFGNPISTDVPAPCAPTKRHKHADLIHAWAEGADIQVYSAGQGWEDAPNPMFRINLKYRIKPDLSKERAELAEVEQQVSKLQAELQRRMGELEPLIDKRDALRKVVRNG